MKVLRCFGLFFGKPNEKTKAEWVVFLKFEYIWMGKCDKMQTIFSSFELSKTNIEESIIDEKVVAVNRAMC